MVRARLDGADLTGARIAADLTGASLVAPRSRRRVLAPTCATSRWG
nr:hypothetical protein [Bradyrhizobium sp. SEMIA]